ncbi:hypothetical protein PSA01_05950 [Pseudonocardia saturnea]|uniref:Secreted protein n=1 Tax=Pseudonocardia saturnea TaxID=33909 RepID=A0ABQ0RSF0_9PSEU|nr:hypothetical protein Pdca_61190 [Pseudonocardia autotrophica]GEC23566.1 hypothetical protein PSA01_05950 [Pseudonocardia saturnea]
MSKVTLGVAPTASTAARVWPAVAVCTRYPVRSPTGLFGAVLGAVLEVLLPASGAADATGARTTPSATASAPAVTATAARERWRLTESDDIRPLPVGRETRWWRG